TLTRYRRYSILVIVIISAIITPTGDPINLAFTAVPMYLLYELGLLLALLAPRRRAPVSTP
ncbi:MAG TPA: twin-arginine translocase subunit TatC, partial [Herpetosiphonaceae bacterium]|nr:twin-arginine translocase subunit TatC [Herpetosiphonaceae bacterium]